MLPILPSDYKKQSAYLVRYLARAVRGLFASAARLHSSAATVMLQAPLEQISAMNDRLASFDINDQPVKLKAGIIRKNTGTEK